MAFTKYKMCHAGLFLLLALFHPKPMANDEMVMAPLWNLSLEELLKVQVTSVASNVASPVREQPAVVSIIHAADIQQAGARDLIDVLRLIPGFEFLHDVGGAIGISFRGLWSYEGRMLLMIDNMEYSDALYGNLLFGQHFSVNQIEKIEIIRGPGAAKYGGNAQLAVIKITTKGKKLNGVETIISSGDMGGHSAFNSVTVNGAKPLETGFIKTSVAVSSSPHSTQQYIDFYGEQSDQGKDSKRNATNINLGGEYQDLEFQLVLDRFQLEEKVFFGSVVGDIDFNFDSDMARLSYPWQLSDEITLISSIDYQRQDNWRTRAREDMTPFLGVSDISFQVETELDRYQLQAHYRPESSMSINAGVMYQQERAYAKESLESLTGISPGTFFNGSARANYQTQAAFFQSDWSNDGVSWSLGGRYSKHSLVGESWVPRISYVKLWQAWHVKGLYSHSFREPEFAVIAQGDRRMKPETTKTSEVEVGYQMSPSKVLAVNVFHTTIEDPIIYSVVGVIDNYSNRADMASRGLEASWHWQPEWGKVKLGYSFYEAIDNPVPEYQVTGKDSLFLGTSQHKLTLDSRYQINAKLSVNPSAIWTSARYGYDYDPSVVVANEGDAQMSLQRFNAELILNVFMNYKNESFALGAGVFDALNTQHQYMQAHNGGGAALPGPGPMLYVKLTYTPDF